MTTITLPTETVKLLVVRASRATSETSSEDYAIYDTQDALNKAADKAATEHVQGDPESGDAEQLALFDASAYDTK